MYLLFRPGLVLCYIHRKIKLLLQSEKELIVPSLRQLRCHWGTVESQQWGRDSGQAGLTPRCLGGEGARLLSRMRGARQNPRWAEGFSHRCFKQLRD